MPSPGSDSRVAEPPLFLDHAGADGESPIGRIVTRASEVSLGYLRRHQHRLLAGERKLCYDSRDISYLAYDLEVDALFAQVGDVGEGGEAQARAILAYLDGEREVDVEAKRYAARLMADTGKLSQREIAAQLRIAQSTVSKWLQESTTSEPAS